MSKKKKKKSVSKVQPPVRQENFANPYDLKSNLNRINQNVRYNFKLEYGESSVGQQMRQLPNTAVGPNVDPNEKSQFDSVLQNFRMEMGKNSSDLKLEVSNNVNSSMQQFRGEIEGKIDKKLSNSTFGIVVSLAGAVILFIATYLFVYVRSDIGELEKKEVAVEKDVEKIESQNIVFEKRLDKVDSLSSERVFEERYKKTKKIH